MARTEYSSWSEVEGVCSLVVTPWRNVTAKLLVKKGVVCTKPSQKGRHEYIVANPSEIEKTTL